MVSIVENGAQGSVAPADADVTIVNYVSELKKDVATSGSPVPVDVSTVLDSIVDVDPVASVEKEKNFTPVAEVDTDVGAVQIDTFEHVDTVNAVSDVSIVEPVEATEIVAHSQAIDSIPQIVVDKPDVPSIQEPSAEVAVENTVAEEVKDETTEIAKVAVENTAAEVIKDETTEIAEVAVDNTVSEAVETVIESASTVEPIIALSTDDNITDETIQTTGEAIAVDTVESSSTNIVDPIASVESEKKLAPIEEVHTSPVNSGAVQIAHISSEEDTKVVEPRVTAVPEANNETSTPSDVDVPITTNTDGDNIPAYLTELLNKIAREHGFKQFTIEHSSGSNHGDNFMSNILRIVISGDDNQKLSLIVKIAPANKIRREKFNILRAFEREVYTYNVVLPLFTEFQTEHGLTDVNGFFGTPKCYAAIADASTDQYVVILEDLQVQGFNMLNKHRSIDFESARSFLEGLGRFHAVSFALRDQKPEVFEQFKALTLPLFSDDTFSEDVQKVFISSYDRAIQALNPHEEYKIERMDKLKSEFVEMTHNLVATKAAEPFSVLNHSDSWINNILFREV